ncbi:hypothetical protein [Frankia sp. Mgl5]|uniref:hypothetical protein n=1 Tax=Frankia sp. Mgl5 TaxID=2933793 RepID=UPI00200E6FC9|nr:hypothetical protein [Frankia sp. Mgl5]
MSGAACLPDAYRAPPRPVTRDWYEGRVPLSTAGPDRLVGPVVEGDFGPANVNVAAQQDDPGSLLSWFTAMIRAYRRCPEFAWGTCTVLDCADLPSVFAHRTDLNGQTVVAVHNLGREPAGIRLALAGVERGDRLVRLAGADEAGGDLVAGDGGAVELDLDGYGFRWLRVHRGGTDGQVRPTVGE